MARLAGPQLVLPSVALGFQRESRTWLMKKVLGSAERGALGAAGTESEETKTSRPRVGAGGLGAAGALEGCWLGAPASS
ncbi:hypothetical protein D3C86_873160 [compost metagenome]